MSNEWISVKDELPSFGEYCLTLDSSGDVEVAVYTSDRDGQYFASIDMPVYDEFGYDRNGKYGEIINVTHWFSMPIFNKG